MAASEEWRPAVAPPGTTTRSEEFAVTDPAQMPVREARHRSQKSPRWSAGGERPPYGDARRLARRLACRVTCRPHGCLASTRRLSALRPPHKKGRAKPKSKPRAQRTRRGNEIGCLKW